MLWGTVFNSTLISPCRLLLYHLFTAENQQPAQHQQQGKCLPIETDGPRAEGKSILFSSDRLPGGEGRAAAAHMVTRDRCGLKNVLRPASPEFTGWPHLAATLCPFPQAIWVGIPRRNDLRRGKNTHTKPARTATIRKERTANREKPTPAKESPDGRK